MKSKKKSSTKLDVEREIKWKIYYDTKNKKPCGVNGNYVAVCGMDESLPSIINKPESVEEREVVLLILKKRKKKKGK